jgi:Domain of unknown function (DUF5615)
MKWEQVTYPAKVEWNEYLAHFKARYGFSYTKKPRYLIDENLGEGTAQLLQTWGCNVKGVWELSLTGHPDENVWRVAQKDKRVLLTHDDDFLDNRQFPLKAAYSTAKLVLGQFM